MATYSDKFNSGLATLYLEVTRDSYSVTNNTSYLKCVLKIKKNSSCSSHNNGGASISMTINGSKLYSSSSFDIRSLGVGNTKTLATKYITVSHNSDGTKSVSCKASFSSGVSLGTANISGTYTCGTIPRASSITSAANKTLGNACSIKWTPKNSSFKYKLKFSLGDWSYTTGYIAPKTTNAYTYTGYTIPNNSTLLAEIPTGTTGTMKVILYSYTSGETSIGNDDATFTVTVPSSVVPTMGTIKIEASSINGKNILLQNQNTIKVTVSECSAGTGSSIKSYKYECLHNGNTVSSKTTTSTSVEFGPFTKSGDIEVKATVVDKRDRVASNTSSTVTCYTYTYPFFSLFTAERKDIEHKTTSTDDDGTVIENVSYTYNINCKGVIANFINDIDGDTTLDNNLAVNLYYQPVGGDQKTAGTYTTNKFEAIIEDVKENDTYTVWATVSDNYTTTPIESEKRIIYASLRIMNIKSDGTFSGTGIGIGQKANNVGYVESAYNIATTEAVNNIDIFDGNGYYMTRPPFDGETQNVIEPAIYRNLNDAGTASNLWIGADGQNGKHFTHGSTYISAGSAPNVYTCKLVDNERKTYKILDGENYKEFLTRLYNSDETGYVTIGYDSPYYYFRPYAASKVSNGSSNNPWYKTYTERLEVTSAKPIFPYIGSDGGGSTVTYSPNMYVGSTGIVSRYSSSSSKTIKHDIKELQDESVKAENLYNLDIVQFKYNEDILSDNDQRYLADMPGFIIEDMVEKYPIAVDKPNDDVKTWSWNIHYLIPPMLKLIQNQKKEIDQLKEELNELKARIL